MSQGNREGDDVTHQKQAYEKPLLVKLNASETSAGSMTTTQNEQHPYYPTSS